MDPHRAGLRIPLYAGGNAVKLRSLLAIFAVGLVFLPVSLLPIFSLIFYPAYSHAPAGPGNAARILGVERAVQEAVRVGSDGALEAKAGFAVPGWMDLVVISESGVVVVSDVPGFPVGERVREGKLDDFAKAFSPNSRFTIQAISGDGRILGAYAARSDSRPLSLGEDPARPFIMTAYLVCLAAIVLGLSGVLGARLASAMRKIERAAERMALGDLSEPVSLRGTSELRSLARAMESMRLALQEDRSRRNRFLASVSHDLRTPLTSVRGYIEALEDGMAEDGAMAARYLGIMRGKTDILADRIDELLDFARMGTGEWKLKLAELDIFPWLEGLSRGYRDDALASSRSFESALEATRGLKAMADAKMLKRALENVFSNALRYAPPGSTVSLSAARSGGSLELVFSDSGPGIPSEDIPRIFDPYFRGSNRSGEGEGLGLSIARSILTDHGWTIRAESPQEGGSRFIIRMGLSGGG
jgi:signal transduction histidine kinase